MLTSFPLNKTSIQSLSKMIGKSYVIFLKHEIHEALAIEHILDNIKEKKKLTIIIKKERNLYKIETLVSPCIQIYSFLQILDKFCTHID